MLKYRIETGRGEGGGRQTALEMERERMRQRLRDGHVSLSGEAGSQGTTLHVQYLSSAVASASICGVLFKSALDN